MRAWPETLVVTLGALAGLAGVALSAAAAHLTGPGGLKTSAEFLLFHAPALLAVAALLATRLVHRGLGLVAAGALALGLTLFCGDLALRALAGLVLVPLAAPVGGAVLMGGWAFVALAALIRPR